MTSTPGTPPAADFDRLVALAREDPQAFEALRLELIEAEIAAAPPAHRKRLRAVQWRIDQLRSRSGSPLGAAIRLSAMMWESLERSRAVLARVSAPQSPPGGPNNVTALEDRRRLRSRRGDR